VGGARWVVFCCWSPPKNRLEGKTPASPGKAIKLNFQTEPIHHRKAKRTGKMKIHFREQYGRKGEEILYVTPAGEQIDQTDQPTTQASYGSYGTKCL